MVLLAVCMSNTSTECVVLCQLRAIIIMSCICSHTPKSGDSMGIQVNCDVVQNHDLCPFRYIKKGAAHSARFQRSQIAPKWGTKQGPKWGHSGRPSKGPQLGYCPILGVPNEVPNEGMYRTMIYVHFVTSKKARRILQAFSGLRLLRNGVLNRVPNGVIPDDPPRGHSWDIAPYQGSQMRSQMRVCTEP